MDGNLESGAASPGEIAVGRIVTAREGTLPELGGLLSSYRNYLLTVAGSEIGRDLQSKVSPSDLVQETCLEASRDIASFTGRSAEEFQGWLRRILLNNLANEVRRFRGSEKRDISKEVSFDENGIHHEAARLRSEEDETPSRLMMHDELVGTIRGAISRLPADFQRVVQLRNYERMAFEAIGEAMDRSAEAARKLWCRAIQRLQDELIGAHDPARP